MCGLTVAEVNWLGLFYMSYFSFVLPVHAVSLCCLMCLCWCTCRHKCFPMFIYVLEVFLIYPQTSKLNSVCAVYSLYNNSFTVAVELDTTTAVDPIQCFDESSGLTGPCPYSTDPLPTPTQGTGVCDRVVKQVSVSAKHVWSVEDDFFLGRMRYVPDYFVRFCFLYFSQLYSVSVHVCVCVCMRMCVRICSYVFVELSVCVCVRSTQQ